MTSCSNVSVGREVHVEHVSLGLDGPLGGELQEKLAVEARVDHEREALKLIVAAELLGGLCIRVALPERAADVVLP